MTTVIRVLGAVCVPAMMAEAYIKRGVLVPVLSEYMPRDLWLHAAYVQRRHNSAALRALLDFLETRVGRGRGGKSRITDAGLAEGQPSPQ
jgi:DNA-binding transcriptional LysR family regulator